jgi:hypothetical protein
MLMAYHNSPGLMRVETHSMTRTPTAVQQNKGRGVLGTPRPVQKPEVKPAVACMHHIDRTDYISSHFLIHAHVPAVVFKLNCTLLLASRDICETGLTD